jgi:hypothetical protein
LCYEERRRKRRLFCFMALQISRLCWRQGLPCPVSRADACTAPPWRCLSLCKNPSFVPIFYSGGHHGRSGFLKPRSKPAKSPAADNSLEICRGIFGVDRNIEKSKMKTVTKSYSASESQFEGRFLENRPTLSLYIIYI